MKKIFYLFLIISIPAIAQDALELPYSIRLLNPKPVDAYYYNQSGAMYTNTAQILSEIPASIRYVGQRFIVSPGVEYWFDGGIADGDLKEYNPPATGFWSLASGGTLTGHNLISGNSTYGIGFGSGFPTTRLTSFVARTINGPIQFEAEGTTGKIELKGGEINIYNTSLSPKDITITHQAGTKLNFNDHGGGGTYFNDYDGGGTFFNDTSGGGFFVNGSTGSFTVNQAGGGIYLMEAGSGGINIDAPTSAIAVSGSDVSINSTNDASINADGSILIEAGAGQVVNIVAPNSVGILAGLSNGTAQVTGRDVEITATEIMLDAPNIQIPQLPVKTGDTVLVKNNGLGYKIMSSGTINGTISANRIAYGVGANTIGGESAFTYNPISDVMNVNSINTASIGGLAGITTAPSTFNLVSNGSNSINIVAGDIATIQATNTVQLTAPTFALSNKPAADNTATVLAVKANNVLATKTDLIDGVGAADRIPIFSDSNTLGSDNELTYNSTTNQLSTRYVIDLNGIWYNDGAGFLGSENIRKKGEPLLIGSDGAMFNMNNEHTGGYSGPFSVWSTSMDFRAQGNIQFVADSVSPSQPGNIYIETPSNFIIDANAVQIFNDDEVSDQLLLEPKKISTIGNTNLDVSAGGTLTLSGDSIYIDNTGINNNSTVLSVTSTGALVLKNDVVDKQVFSGTYSPTFSDMVNLTSASSPNGLLYDRTDNVVTVSGWVLLDPTASGEVSFSISIPVPSNPLVPMLMAGSGSIKTVSEVFPVYVDEIDGKIRITWYSDNAAFNRLSFVARYRVNPPPQ